MFTSSCARSLTLLLVPEAHYACLVVAHLMIILWHSTCTHTRGGRTQLTFADNCELLNEFFYTRLPYNDLIKAINGDNNNKENVVGIFTVLVCA